MNEMYQTHAERTCIGSKVEARLARERPKQMMLLWMTVDRCRKLKEEVQQPKEWRRRT